MDKLGVPTRVLTGSEHVKSRVSIGSIHVFPYVNSRESGDKSVSICSFHAFINVFEHVQNM